MKLDFFPLLLYLIILAFTVHFTLSSIVTELKKELLGYQTMDKHHTSVLSRDPAAENALKSRKSPANTASCKIASVLLIAWKALQI
jgi:hypothetical protein